MTEAEKIILNEKEILLYRDIGTGLYRFSKEAVEILLQAFEEVEQYRAIGTIEEFKALKEKSLEKKVDEEYCCPICHTCGMDDDGIAGDYCTNCGQKLDWQ